MGVAGNLFEERSLIIEDIETGEQKNTYYDWKIVSKSRILIAPPVPKTSYTSLKSADGYVDQTESFDRVLYENREGSWTFYFIDTEYFKEDEDIERWNRTYSNMMNFLQGKRVKVKVMDDPNFYWIGRLNVGSIQPESGRATYSINYSLEPYKYELEEVESGTINVSGTASTTAYGSAMDTSPLFNILSSDYALKPNDKISRGEAVRYLYEAATALGTTKSISSGATMPFGDVLETKDYYNAVLWASSRGYVSGYTPTVFAPENLIARGQFLNIIYKIKGSPSATGTIPFTDVQSNSYCYKAVRWAFNKGYVTGDGNKHFYPNQPITRAQALFILWKVAGSPSTSSTANFIDVKNGGDIKPWYYDAIVYAKQMGFISGHADGTFKPSDGITRGQFITILYRYAREPFDPEYTNPFDDVSSTDYYYQAVCWAYANGGAQNIVSGTTSETFSPNRILLRKEAIAILYKYAQVYMSARVPFDEDDIAGIETPSDVATTAYYYEAVCWAVFYGVTALDDGFRFSPDTNCTRAMACQFVYALETAAYGEIDLYNLDTGTTTEPTTTTETTDNLVTNPQWRQGYYDSDQNDLILDTSYLRTVFLGLSQSTFGNVTHIVLDVPTEFLWKIHWFSYVDNSTQTLLSETAWAYGSSSQQVLSKPSGATNFMIGLMFRDGATSSTQTDNVSLTWEVGSIGTQGDDISGSIVNSNIKSNMFSVSDADSVIVTWSITDNDWNYVLFWYTDDERDRDYYISDTDWQTPTGNGHRVHNKPAGAKYACFLLTDGSNQQMYTSQAQYFSAQTNRTVLIGANITSSDGADVSIYRRVTTTTTTGGDTSGGGDDWDGEDPYPDVTITHLYYITACRWAVANGLLESQRSGMDVTIENDHYVSRTAEVPTGEDVEEPYLRITKGENIVTFTGNGTASFHFKKGSL